MKKLFKGGNLLSNISGATATPEHPGILDAYSVFYLICSAFLQVNEHLPVTQEQDSLFCMHKLPPCGQGCGWWCGQAWTRKGPPECIWHWKPSNPWCQICYPVEATWTSKWHFIFHIIVQLTETTYLCHFASSKFAKDVLISWDMQHHFPLPSSIVLDTDTHRATMKEMISEIWHMYFSGSNQVNFSYLLDFNSMRISLRAFGE